MERNRRRSEEEWIRGEGKEVELAEGGGRDWRRGGGGKGGGGWRWIKVEG